MLGWIHPGQSLRFGEPFLVDDQPCGVHVDDLPLTIDLEVVVADVPVAVAHDVLPVQLDVTGR